MKSSLFLVGVSALLATASPVERRAMVTEVVTDMVTVTVVAQESTSTPPPPPPPTTHKEKPKPATSAPPPPPPSPKPTPVAPKVEVQQVQPSPKPQPTPQQQQQQQQPQSSASQSSDSGDLDAYQKGCVDSHNQYRADHSAGPLQWDSDLAAKAQEQANGCQFAHNMGLGGSYGQNIYAASGSSSSSAGSDAAKDWYSEAPLFSALYGLANPGSGGFLHFTQMVWKSTTHVGCATVSCPSGTVLGGFPGAYTVCNYYPQGNMAGEYGSNVLN